MKHFMSDEVRPDRNIALGKRLALARKALGYTKRGAQKAFAMNADLADNTYNQWEKGASYPDLTYMLKLCDRYPGLTLDWIYRGEFRGLTQELIDGIKNQLDGKPVPMTPTHRPPAAPLPTSVTKVVDVRDGRRRSA